MLPCVTYKEITDSGNIILLHTERLFKSVLLPLKTTLIYASINIYEKLQHKGKFCNLGSTYSSNHSYDNSFDDW